MFDRPIDTAKDGTDPLEHLSRDHTAGATGESLRKYERIAPVYDLLDGFYEISWKARLRKHAFDGLTGRVLDAGAGTGCNIPFYPHEADVMAADLSPSMLARARRRADKHGRTVTFRETDLTATGLDDDSFDAAVATYVFCVIPEEVARGALMELARITKPGGTIRILDYCESQKPMVRAWTRVMSPWLNWAFAARYTARYEQHARDAGLVLEDSRHVMGDVVKLLTLRVPAA